MIGIFTIAHCETLHRLFIGLLFGSTNIYVKTHIYLGTPREIRLNNRPTFRALCAL